MSPDTPAPLATLLADLSTCDSAFCLMERLMQFCRDQAVAYRLWEEDIQRQVEVPPARDDARQVVATFGGSVFTTGDPPEVLDAIRGAVAGYIRRDSPPPVIRAELLLLELDRVLTPAMRSLYPDDYPGPLGHGRLFPVYWPNLKHNGWLPSHRLSTAPRSLAQPPGFLPQWGLAPSLDVFAGREVQFHYGTRTDVSPALTGPLKLGVGVLNGSTDDLTFELERTPPLRFRGVRPRPELLGSQITAMCDIATRAGAEGVRVLVFPELCVDRSGAEQVFEHIAGLAPRPALVVIGSHHWQDGDDRRNTCTAHRCGTPAPLVHHKLTRYSHPQGGETYQEDIRPGNTIRVFVSTDWSVILLICRDFLDTSVRQLVERLRPTFLCIPSYSGSSTPFVEPAGALTDSAQTIVVFANGPIPTDRAVGVFGVPRTPEVGSGSTALSRQAIATELFPQLPCLVIYDGASDRITALPC